MNVKVKLIECPRDAIQGIKHFIPTQKKIAYLNYLLSLNIFDTLDFGSFVSIKAVPQMADTQLLINELDTTISSTKLLAIVANKRGAEQASNFQKINYLGYPFSVSETFQLKNTNTTRLQSLETVKYIQELCAKNSQELVVYISMAFGNPYNDSWNAEIVLEWVEKLKEIGIKIFSLADTTSMATEESLFEICNKVYSENKNIEIGLHLHTFPNDWKQKFDIAYNIGIRRFDGAILGYGGCPMAQNELVGNMPTENLLEYFNVSESQTINEIKIKFLELIN